MSAKTGKQCQFGQDMTYHNLQSAKVPMQILWYYRYRSRTLHIGPHCHSHVTYRVTWVEKQADSVNLVKIWHILPQYAVQKSFHANFVVLKISVAHVTYRVTVTATLQIGPHECKNKQTVSIWSRYDISYHNMLSRKVSMQILWY